MKQMQNKQQFDEQHQIISATTISSSPFPPPETLEKYKEIDPNLVERTFQYTEINGQHRREMEKDALNTMHKENMTELKQQDKGQIYAITVVALFLGTSLFSAFNGFETLSIVLGSATAITGIVNAFLKIKDKNK
jgi:uncharacterized membrane protein